MQPFRKWRPAVLRSAVISALLLSLLSASAEVRDKADKRGRGGKKKKNAAAVSASPTQGEQSLTNIPLPIGQEAKGLTLPDFDIQGRLRGKFVAGSAKRIDQDHVGFRDLKITTFNENSQVDIEIEMSTSTFDLTTRILTSDEKTTVRRADFNVVGDSAVFDTNARTSRMIGNVRMVITSQGQDRVLGKPTPSPTP